MIRDFWEIFCECEGPEESGLGMGLCVHTVPEEAMDEDDTISDQSQTKSRG
jgi:hypothetical protein